MFAARRLVASKASVRAFSAMPARKSEFPVPGAQCRPRSSEGYIIQDLYIKELKAFKPTPISAKDAEGATRPWKKPVAPAAPGLEVDAASELASYESADVEVAAPSKNTAGEQVSEEWFVLEEPEDDHH
ncbi:ATP synthase subunit H, mitochondrial [Cyberlindnera fabianii]|uniref:ATP synthase subunit H, mitochondrial n=1 Tax=Cyberlindnera fabianii TaxID=36022 RepID=A0A1V2L624_CYBFA|nr:ATP synthase subunit H, mitochondrial [Cyberlindnera fabianii]